ncbi:hypothetical protein ABZP36_013643 [Zizania latifolia]
MQAPTGHGGIWSLVNGNSAPAATGMAMTLYDGKDHGLRFGLSTTISPYIDSRSEDPVWAHGKVVLGAKNSTICLHCGKKFGGGGITRLKYHLAGFVVKLRLVRRCLVISNGK